VSDKSGYVHPATAIFFLLLTKKSEMIQICFPAKPNPEIIRNNKVFITKTV